MKNEKKSPNYRTAYSEQKKSHTPTGKMLEPTYGYEVNKQGQKILVCTGQTNVWEKIQESLEESKIENILKRVAAGDNSVFRPDAIYQDLTIMPKNLIEAKQMMQQLENTWNGLPTDIKNKYDNDLELFIAKAGSEKWMKDMGIIQEAVTAAADATSATSAPTEEKGDSSSE